MATKTTNSSPGNISPGAKREWSPDSGEVETVIPVPEHLHPATFRDEQEAGDYHLTISVNGGHIYAREMDDASYARFLTMRQSYAGALQAPGIAEERARALEAAGKAGEAAKKRLEAIHGVQQAEKTNQDFTVWLLEKTIAGWSFARAFTPKAFMQLRGEDQQAVLSRIIQASGLGRSDADFLADASSTA